MHVAEVPICPANVAAWLGLDSETQTGGHVAIAEVNALRRVGSSINFSAAKKKRRDGRLLFFSFFCFVFSF